MDNSLLYRKRCLQSGFSLIEMAIVMVIVGALLGGLLVSLSSTQEINDREDTTGQVEEIMDALFGFAQANGRLPCPATATSNGVESPVGGGNCTQEFGFVPSATLGLSGTTNADLLLVDPWLSPFRYNVTAANGNAFTTPAGMQTAGLAALAPDLRVCTDAACGTVLASALPVVVLSLGPDWEDFSSADEVENSGEVTINGYRQANDANFVSATYIVDQFDDTIRWMSPNILYTRMISAGQLP